MEYPNTILYPDAFDRNKPAGFDGVFDWAWTQGCFGDTNITPTDFDGVVERMRNYLVIETKDPDVKIKRGQLLALDNLSSPLSFLVMKIWGKTCPESFYWNHTYIDGTRISSGMGYGVAEAKKRVQDWYIWADKH